MEDDEPLALEPRTEYDQCIVGIADRFTSRFLVYDKGCILRVIREGGSSEEEALEHFQFNIVGGWVGDGTPAFIEPFEDE